MKLKTPFYYYDLALLQHTLEQLKAAIADENYHIHYAMKANAEARVLKMVRQYGIGVDCVSGGEIQHALDLGFQANAIVYAGVGKTDEELELAIGIGVYGINCESIEELTIINAIAQRLNKKIDVFLRINPNIDAKTHPNITTGTIKNKFGIPIKDLMSSLEEVEKCDHLNFAGLHFHIGSQIQRPEPFVELCKEVNDIQKLLVEKGMSPKSLNLGGGLGIDYEQPEQHPMPDFKSYFDIFKKNLTPLNNQEVHFELGRSIVGQMGALVTKVLYVKKTDQVDFAIVDAGMTELMRPALYGAHHFVENVTSTMATKQYEVVGPICESTDTFGSHDLAQVRRGDLLKISSVGAYASVLFSTYNMRKHPNVVFSDEKTWNQLLMDER